MNNTLVNGSHSARLLPWIFGVMVGVVVFFTAQISLAQSAPVDCNCLLKLSGLRTNACLATVPDLCQIASNCFSTSVLSGGGSCNQTPAAGTIVGPGTTYITLTVTDNTGTSAQCVVPFTVTPGTGCTFSLICASNKTVECGSTWAFDPPTWTNACSSSAGGGVSVVVVSTVTNGYCPQVITQTWQAGDACGYQDQCSQTVTVIDTTPPVLNCSCLTNNAALPLQLTVVACTSAIPDLCMAASFCASDACGIVGCSQSPPAGTPVGPGVYPVSVTMFDCASNSASCVVSFTVLAPTGGCNPGCVPPPSGMVAWWPLDELCGASAYADVTGNGNAAVVESGGPACNFFSPNAVAGQVAGAAYFYGPTVRGRAINSPSLNFGVGSFSADCWVNPVLTGTIFWHPIVDKLNQTGPGAGTGYSVSLLNTKVVLVTGNGLLYTNTSLGSVNYGVWNFVAVAVDRVANTVTFNVNGVVDPPQPLAGAGSYNSPVDLLIGGTYAAARPYGELGIDELELFGRAITTNDMNLVWSAGSLGKCKPGSPCTNSVVSIFCPPNTNVSTCLAGVVVNYPNPADATSCGVITNLTCTPPSGSFFPVGTTTVNCMAIDSQGNSASCSFTVTVSIGANCCTPTPSVNLFSGHNNNGLLPGGSLDPQFLVGPPLFTSPNPYVPSIIHPAWLPNSAASQWVGPYPSYANAPAGVFLYTNRFFLCSTNEAALSGRWTADDTGTIFINGIPTTNTLPAGWSFTNWHNMAINSGFVPGWNNLVFAVTNSGGPTGLRTEITGTNCCNQCVAISCPASIVTNTCAPGAIVNYPLPVATDSCGAAVTITSSPPSGSFFPIGTSVVVVTAVDGLGNAATCSFTVSVLGTGGRVTLRCPPNQTIYTCSTSAVAYYNAFATGNTGPITYSPPSGSSFPIGTNIVVCSATNACSSAGCSFLVIVASTSVNLTYQAGLPDNFAYPTDPASLSACIVTAFSGFPYWKNFDDTNVNTIFGHRFSGLPNNVLSGALITRMKPGDDGYGIGVGSDNDGLFMGLPTCTFSSFLYAVSIKTLPGTGGNWFPNHPPVTFVIPLTPALIAHINSVQHLDIAVHDDTTVDYMTLQLRTCPPPRYPFGTPHWLPSIASQSATLVAVAQPELPTFGLIGRGEAMSIAPPDGDTSASNSVQIGVGGASAFGFTTILDTTMPDNSDIVVSVHDDDAGIDSPVLTLTKLPCASNCLYQLSLNDQFFAGGASTCRVSALNTNGDMLDSYIATQVQAESESLLTFSADSGTQQFPVSFLLDWATGQITVSFPGSVARRLCNGLPCPRGWDGTIKGRLAPDGTPRGWDGTVKCPCVDDGASRIVIAPLGVAPASPPGLLQISSAGMSQFTIADERVYAMGGEIASVNEPAAVFQGGDSAQSVSFTSVADNTGVSLDLGNAASVDVGFAQIADGTLTGQQQLLEFSGPRWPTALTNRPPPPPIDLRLAQSSNGVACYADFYWLQVSAVTVQLWSNGALVSQQSGDGNAFAFNPIMLDSWPERASLQSAGGGLRLTSSQPFSWLDCCTGDELRIIPNLSPGADVPASYSTLQISGSQGLQSILYDARPVTAVSPPTLNIIPSPGQVSLLWSDDRCHAQVAGQITGPWYDLNATSPASIPEGSGPRFYRLVGR